MTQCYIVCFTLRGFCTILSIRSFVATEGVHEVGTLCSWTAQDVVLHMCLKSALYITISKIIAPIPPLVDFNSPKNKTSENKQQYFTDNH